MFDNSEGISYICCLDLKELRAFGSKRGAAQYVVINKKERAMRKTQQLIGLCCLLAFWCAGILPAVAQDDTADKHELVITGTVRDRETRKKLENVTVALVGTTIGTVTNAEGVFSLKIPRQQSAAQLELSHLGYLNTRFSATAPADAADLSATIWMTPAAQQLDEVVVYGGNARRIVEEALKKIPANYSLSDNLLSAFYRETIQKRHRYIGISEAMIDVYKTDYAQREVERDRVQLGKARRLLSQKQSDTLAVKVVGGPNLAIYLDVVKNADALFDAQTMEHYAFEQEASVMLDDRIHYVIRFRPRVSLAYALFAGKLFIDRERLSFTRAEFSLDLSNREKAVAAILHRKPMGLRFRPQEVNFLVTYRQQNGLTTLNYICNEIRFKCDWKRRLFSSTYTARSEMVVVEREAHPDRVIARRDAFKPGQIFYDVVPAYWNENYWKDYNIIEPTESLENAVKKLKKQR